MSFCYILYPINPNLYYLELLNYLELRPSALSQGGFYHQNVVAEMVSIGLFKKK